MRPKAELLINMNRRRIRAADVQHNRVQRHSERITHHCPGAARSMPAPAPVRPREDVSDRDHAFRFRPDVRSCRRDQLSAFPHAVKCAVLDLPRAERDDFFAGFRRMLEQRAQCCRVWEGAELIAVAGTHVWSEAERVVAIGNVFIDRYYTPDEFRELRRIGLEELGFKWVESGPLVRSSYRADQQVRQLSKLNYIHIREA